MFRRQILEQLELVWEHMQLEEFDPGFVEAHTRYIAELSRYLRTEPMPAETTGVIAARVGSR